MPIVRKHRVCTAVAFTATLLTVGLLTTPAQPSSAATTPTAASGDTITASLFQCIPGSGGIGYSYGNTPQSLFSGAVYLPSGGSKKKLQIGTGAIDWAAAAAQLDASGRKFLFSLKWVQPLVAYYEDERLFADRDQALERARQIVIDLDTAYPVHGPDSATARLAWDGWVTALRTETQACLARSLDPADPAVAVLDRSAEFLADPANDLGSWNQGLEQYVALLAAGCLRSREDWVSLADARVRATVGQSILADGAVNEQSIGYAAWTYTRWVVYRQVASDCQIPLVDTLQARLAGALRFMTDATRPDGTLALIGDMEPGTVRTDIQTDSPELLWAATRGARGSAPIRPTAMTVYRDGGYLFARTGWGVQRPALAEDYLTVRFGPRRYAHGHYDHTSLTWFHAGRGVLIDSGFSGYSHPARTWLTSPEAHNTLTIPGVPYRSYSTSTLVATKETSSTWYAQVSDQAGTDGGAYQGLTRRRSILTAPAEGIVVVLDRTDPKYVRWMYRTQAKNSVRWWHLPSAAKVVSVDKNRVRASLGTRRAVTVVDVPLPWSTGTRTWAVSGQTKPYQGWQAGGTGKMTAAPAVGMASGVGQMISVIVDSTSGSAVTTALAPSGKGWLLKVTVGKRTSTFWMNLSTGEITKR